MARAYGQPTPMTRSNAIVALGKGELGLPEPGAAETRDPARIPHLQLCLEVIPLFVACKCC